MNKPMNELISEHRTRLNLSQTKFAAAHDTTVTTISRLESGKQIPGGPLTVRLALSGIPLADLHAAFELDAATKKTAN